MAEIKIVNQSSNPIPEYQTAHAAGLDLRANLDAPIMLEPLGRALVGTGLYIQLPDGYEAQIRPRSGLAAKNGITLLNAPGTIDADYRGEIKVLLVNLSSFQFSIEHSMRIAQMVIAPYTRATLHEVETLEKSARGTGGFGHTGIN